jgi:thiol-disulfide isomerase/thioredoxin
VVGARASLPAPGRRKYLLAAAALVAVSVGAVLFAGHTNATRLGSGNPASLPVGPAAPTLNGAKGWLNSSPLTATDLTGKVVLYDFWTYSCVNCVRTLPSVRSWYTRYASDGLEVVGIHSPEFNFEKVHTNVARAVQRLGVSWPVALDDDMAIWNAFSNQYWPADYVADRQGRIRYTHFGEGDYQSTEDVLRRLLGVDAHSPRAVPSTGAQSTAGASSASITPETYLGTSQGQEGARPGPATYPEPGVLPTNRVALVGGWIGEPEDDRSTAMGSSVILAYRAREVNLVMGTAAAGGRPVDALVELDGKPLPPEFRTSQTMIDGEGRTFVRVDVSDMYRLVLGPTIGNHTLRVIAQGPGLLAFDFTFGG